MDVHELDRWAILYFDMLKFEFPAIDLWRQYLNFLNNFNIVNYEFYFS